VLEGWTGASRDHVSIAWASMGFTGFQPALLKLESSDCRICNESSGYTGVRD
jgi:hypothetical protein